MNKRQLKKKNKKCLPVVADEYTLLTITGEEREKAYSDYLKFVKKYSYRKKYKNLKGKHLIYYYPVGEQVSSFIKEISQRSRKYKNPRKESILQSINDFTFNKGMIKKLRSTPVKVNACIQTLEDIIKINED